LQICPSSLAGKTISIVGLAAAITEVLASVDHPDGSAENDLLLSPAPLVTSGSVTTLTEKALIYVQLGLRHIRLGADH
jgi:hypothetical protein